MSVWHDGRAWDDGERPAASDRALLLGDGLFETVLVRDGTPCFPDRHLARMRASASTLGFVVPADLEATLATAVEALWQQEEGPSRAALRVTLSRGSGRGLDVPEPATAGLWICLSALPDTPGGVPAAPACAVVVETPRIDPAHPATGHKTVSALGWVLARRAARERGAQTALLRTLDGDVCEADSANLLVVLDGRVVTPPLDRGVLPGITRARCLEALRSAGRPVVEARISLENLVSASEILATSSLVGVRPLTLLGRAEHPHAGPVATWLAVCLEDEHGAEGRRSASRRSHDSE